LTITRSGCSSGSAISPTTAVAAVRKCGAADQRDATPRAEDLGADD
jgi:hypothetical protein